MSVAYVVIDFDMEVQPLVTQHAHTYLSLGVHVPPGTAIWGYKLKFEGTWKSLIGCSYFNSISPYPWKLAINFDPWSFLLPEFDMHLLKSTTLLFS